MKKVQRAMKRLLALGISIVLMAGSVPQTVLAAGVNEGAGTTIFAVEGIDTNLQKKAESIDDPADPTNGAEDPTDPADPTNGAGDPTDPADPDDEGGDPSDPDDPDDPDDGNDDPDEPEDPTEPTDPADPTDPEDNTDDPADPEEGTDEPGDASSVESSSDEAALDTSLDEEEILEEDKDKEEKLVTAENLPGTGKTPAALGLGYKLSKLGQYVYYGKYEGQPVKYRLLTRVESAGLLLDSDKILFNSVYYSSGSKATWDLSDLKRDLNGEEFLDKDGVFTTIEKNSLAPTFDIVEGIEGLRIDGEKIFLLNQYQAVADKYGYDNPETRKKRDVNTNEVGRWWTIEFNLSHNQPYWVDENGELQYSTGYGSRGVAPAFFVDRSKLIFASQIDYSGAPQVGNSGASLSLALLDDALRIKTTGRSSYVDGVVKIPFEVNDYSDVSDPDYIMVFSTPDENEWTENGWSYDQYSQKKGELIQCEKFDYDEVKELGELTFSSDNININNCYIVAVDENGVYESDYASAPVKVENFYANHEELSPVKYVKQGSNTFSIASAIAEGGKASFSSVEDPEGILSGKPTVSGSKLNVTVKSGIEAGKSATIAVSVKGAKDYAPYTVNVKVIVAQKTVSGLGTDVMANPNLPASALDSWSGSYVHYGKYDGDTLRYRVLSKSTDQYSAESGSKTMLLDCDTGIYVDPFDEDGIPNPGAAKVTEWNYSDPQVGLNGEKFLTKDGCFTGPEKDAIAESTIESGVTTPLHNDKIFLLDEKDVVNEAYGYPGSGSNHALNKDGLEMRCWALRTPLSSDYLRCVSCKEKQSDVTKGNVTFIVAKTNQDMSPAFNVDLSSVVFSDLNQYGSSNGAGEIGAEYTLAIKDSGLSIKTTEAPKIDKNGNVSIAYAITNKSSLSKPDSVVAVVTDGVWTSNGWSDGARLLQKAQASASGTKGTIKFKLDSSITGDYNIYIVALDETMPFETDYASVPVSVSMMAESIGYEGVYDGKAHGITVTVLSPRSGATVKYGTKEGTYNLTTSPKYTDASDSPRTVYYKITASGYAAKTGSATVMINKADPTLTAPTAREGLTYNGSDQVLVNKGYTDFGTICYAMTAKGEEQPQVSAFTETLPKATNAGDYDVWYMVKGDKNHNDVAPVKVEASIAKAVYTGTKHVYKTVYANSGNLIAFCKLPGLPDGAEYPDISKCAYVSGTKDFMAITGIQVADGNIPFLPELNDGSYVLLFNAYMKPSGTTATYKVPITEIDNYADFDVLVTVTGSELDHTEVSIEGGDRTVEYGSEGFTLTGKAAEQGDNVTWTWESSAPTVADVDSTTGEVTIKKAGTTNIKATYISDSATGSAEICLTVKKKPVDITWSNTSFKFNGDTQAPMATVTGVIDGDKCSVEVSGGKKYAGEGYIATAGLAGDDAGNYVTDADQTSCIFSIGTAELTENLVTLGDALTYNARKQTQNVLVKIGDNDVTDQCTVTGNTGTNAGSYTLTVSANEGGNLTGSVTKVFTIAKKDTAPNIKVEGSYHYTGTLIEPKFTVNEPDTGMVLFTDQYNARFEDNINAGKGKIIITAAADGNYAFSEKTQEFEIYRVRMHGDTNIYITRSYPYNEQVSDAIDLNQYIPEGFGDPTYGSVERNGTVYYVSQKEPRMEGNKLCYTVRAGDASRAGTITVNVTGSNYLNAVTISVTVRQQAMGLVEKNKTDAVLSTTKEIAVGKSFTLTPAFLDEEVTNTRVVWSSSNPDVASVNQSGKVTGHSAGFAEIIAISEYDPGVVLTQCGVTVFDRVTAISLDKKSCVVGVDEIGETITATVLPYSAAQKLVWTADNENANIEVSEDGLSIKVIGVTEGKTVITAAAVDDSGKKATCNVTVGAPITDYSVSPKGGITVLEVGKSYPMDIEWADNIVPIKPQIKWETEKLSTLDSADDVATISDDGVITGVGEGRCYVYAKYAGKERASWGRRSDLLTFYVPVKSVALNMTSATVSQAPGANSVQLEANITSTVPGLTATGTSLRHAPTVTWSVDPKYADSVTVSDTGLVTAGTKTAKNVPVTATVEAFNGYKKTVTCKVTVAATNPLKGISISKKKLSIGEGDTATLTANLSPVNPDGDMGYTWASSNESVVKVEDGVITALKPGSATVTVKANGTVTKKGKTVNPSASCKVTVTPSVKAVTFTNAKTLENKGLVKGKTFTLKTKLTLTRSKGKAATKGLVWTSSDTSIATVSKKGVVKAIAPGTVTITATSAASKAYGEAPFASVTFDVRSIVKKIAIDKSKLTVGTQEGKNYGLVSVYYVQPTDVTDPSVKWTVGGKNVSLAAVKKNTTFSAALFGKAGASVTTKDGEVLAIKGVAPGVVKLTGVATDGSKKKVTCTVTVRGQITGLKLKTAKAKKGVNDVTLTDPLKGLTYSGNMKAGAFLKLAPIVDIDGVSGAAKAKAAKKTYSKYKKYTDTSVSYRSSNTAVATVAANGKVTVAKTAQEGDTATIYVTSVNGRYAVKYTVTVVK
ncbi:MAG: Ig-like domain-containing protein [Butyrivibrio sp.]|nr:Ig-like domain-containing protein [Butyrivibrio sp.]